MVGLEGVSQAGSPVAWHERASRLRQPPLSGRGDPLFEKTGSEKSILLSYCGPISLF